MAIAQATIPVGFANLWRVAGCLDEHEHAQKLCRVLGYEVGEEGEDLVRVVFVDRTDLFEAQEALLHPHMLLRAQSKEKET